MNQSYYNMNSIYNSFTRMAMPELEGKHLFIPNTKEGTDGRKDKSCSCFPT